MTIITTETGVKLDFGNKMAKSLTEYARKNGLKVLAAAADFPDGDKTYVLLVENADGTGLTPIFENTLFEACCFRIDAMRLAKEL